MLKKIPLLLLTLSLLLSLSMTAHASVVDQDEMYAALQEELRARLNGEDGAAEFSVLAKQFGDLGVHYRKNAQFRIYATILADTVAMRFDNLETYKQALSRDGDFCALLAEEGFPSVEAISAYALGRAAEDAGDWAAAIGYYEQSISVMDSMSRMLDLMLAEPTAAPTPATTPIPAPPQDIVAPTPTPPSTLITSSSNALSRSGVYQALLEELQLALAGDASLSFAELKAQFESLGSYKKSAAFTYYTAILADAESGSSGMLQLYASLLRLDEDFCTQLVLDGYPTVDEIEAYALGRQAEAAGDLSTAMGYYEQSIAVMDSLMRLTRIQTMLD